MYRAMLPPTSASTTLRFVSLKHQMWPRATCRSSRWVLSWLVFFSPAGSSLANATTSMVYLRSAGDFAAMNEVYATYFPKDPPARTTVVVPQPLANADGLVEISMVAVPAGGERVVVHPSGWIKSP